MRPRRRLLEHQPPAHRGRVGVGIGFVFCCWGAASLLALGGREPPATRAVIFPTRDAHWDDYVQKMHERFPATFEMLRRTRARNSSEFLDDVQSISREWALLDATEGASLPMIAKAVTRFVTGMTGREWKHVAGFEEEIEREVAGNVRRAEVVRFWVDRAIKNLDGAVDRLVEGSNEDGLTDWMVAEEVADLLEGAPMDIADSTKMLIIQTVIRRVQNKVRTGEKAQRDERSPPKKTQPSSPGGIISLWSLLGVVCRAVARNGRARRSARPEMAIRRKPAADGSESAEAKAASAHREAVAAQRASAADAEASKRAARAERERARLEEWDNGSATRAAMARVAAAQDVLAKAELRLDRHTKTYVEAREKLRLLLTEDCALHDRHPRDKERMRVQTKAKERLIAAVTKAEHAVSKATAERCVASATLDAVVKRLR